MRIIFALALIVSAVTATSSHNDNSKEEIVQTLKGEKSQSDVPAFKGKKSHVEMTKEELKLEEVRKRTASMKKAREDRAKGPNAHKKGRADSRSFIRQEMEDMRIEDNTEY
jgi:hypothetical protein